MTLVRTLSSIAALTVATLATAAWAATDDHGVGHTPSATAAVQPAQAQPGSPGKAMGKGMGMGNKSTSPAYADQMKAMQEMHNKMLAAKTPEERHVLMAEHRQVMQNGMSMMGGMGGMGAGGMMDKPTDTAARQGMMEQRMDMMHSMMQMMMDDRMQSVPAPK